MSNSIDGIRGVQNNPAADSQNQGRVTGAAADQADKAKVSNAPTDTVVLTDLAAQTQKVDKVLAETPEVDQAKVKQIKAAIANGNYQVNAELVAEKLVEFEAAAGSKSKE